MTINIGHQNIQGLFRKDLEFYLDNYNADVLCIKDFIHN